jgi:hypothetical protein
LNEKPAFYQTFIDSLIPFPIKNFDKAQSKDKGIEPEKMNKLLEVRAVYEVLSTLF